MFIQKLFSNSGNKKNKPNRAAVNNNIFSYAVKSKDELLAELSDSQYGLSNEKADEIIEEFGPNIISAGNSHGIIYRFVTSLVNTFNIILFLVAVITFFTDVLFSDSPDYLTVIVILVLIVLSSMISFVLGEKSNSAAANLSKLISNKISVLRDGEFAEIDINNVVKGDIVKLSAGDMLPGDVRFLTTNDTFLSQAALTGESAPVEKFDRLLTSTEAYSITDIPNTGLMGSDLVSGTATAIVIATGNDTYLGSMAKSLSNKRAKNNFEKGVDSVSKLLLTFTLVMVPIIFLINGLVKNDWANSLLFSVTMAVGLTPEMLPVITTSTLARGAIAMSKHETIVKNMPAIQSFGEMDILCTDKTGTLTEDKIVLEKYIDTKGNDSERILKHAFLNSYFQTGLKNLIDVAIINRVKENSLDYLKDNYKHIDEIPFDFQRRRMSVVLIDKQGKKQMITKGAVEEIVSICKYIDVDGDCHILTEEEKAEALAIYEKFNRQGLRMLGVCQKNEIVNNERFSVEDESNMVLLGFVGFLDPPKKSAKSAVRVLRTYGVDTIVLTGDSEGVAINVCDAVGIDTNNSLTGAKIELMSDEELKEAVNHTHVYAKLSPNQKERVIKALQSNGHTVGYMGDGINDTLAMRAADVGISVDNAVDIAKETADIILLKKDLMVLEQGVLEGRKTFGNITKYIKMAASGNLGNVISVIFASMFLPFTPMLPVQILAQNLICDLSQIAIPFDSVDLEFLKEPRKWDTPNIRKFMVYLGPVSSIFDILCYLALWFIFSSNGMMDSHLFQCGVFAYGTISQLIVVHFLRTTRRPFIDSKPALSLLFSTLFFTAFVLVITFTSLAGALDMASLPLFFAGIIAALVLLYCVSLQLMKRFFRKKNWNWL